MQDSREIEERGETEKCERQVEEIRAGEEEKKRKKRLANGKEQK